MDPSPDILAALHLIRADLEDKNKLSSPQSSTSEAGAPSRKKRTYAIAHAVYDTGEKVHIARTFVDNSGDQSPIWSHLTGWGIRAGSKCEIQVIVMMSNRLTSHQLVGTANARLENVLNKGICSLDLILADSSDSLGSVTLQVFSFCKERLPKKLSLKEVKVDPQMFLQPVSPISKSGGTAAFYDLQLVGASDDEATYWIGKDLQHTPQENVFYAGRDNYFKSDLDELSHADESKLADLLKFMFEGLGVATLPKARSSDSPGESSLNLLVIKNLFHSCRDLRMLDVKIGQKTASSQWYGKSKMKAKLREPVDKYATNSGAEGCRLAGFNGKPSSLTSRNPTLHLLPLIEAKTGWAIVLSNLSCDRFVRYFMDMHDKALPSDETLALIPDEVLEISMNEMISKLVALVISCRKVVVPQKWVGSSICIGFDAEHVADRKDFSEAEGALRKKAFVNIFDWGRSELNTMASHMALNEASQQDRAEYWQYYVTGVDRLAYHLLRLYRHRFCNVGSLESLTCVVYDHNAAVVSKLHPDEHCCAVDLPIEDTHGKKTLKFLDRGSKEKGALTYSMSYRSLPKGARLQGYWQVTLHKAADLPTMDWREAHKHYGRNVLNQLDPYAVLTATTRSHLETGKCDVFVSKLQGRVVESTVNPEWEETFCIPIASEDGLAAALDASAPRLSAVLGKLGIAFPQYNATADEIESGLHVWIKALNDHVVKECIGAPVGRVTLMDATKDDIGSAPEKASKQKRSCCCPCGGNSKVKD